MTGSSSARALSATAPEAGQSVDVRCLQWLVADVDASAVSPELPKRHIVRLSPVDEHALVEVIEVLWELEPGPHTFERTGLPSLGRLDDAPRLDAFLDAVRSGGATKAGGGLLLASFRTGVNHRDAR